MLRPSKLVVTIINYRKEQKEWVKNNKTKRIAQVSFQARIDTSNGSTTARSESREIQTQQLMPVRVSR